MECIETKLEHCFIDHYKHKEEEDDDCGDIDDLPGKLKL
jgi:hypothetical protein